jgi:hypothetical protein
VVSHMLTVMPKFTRIDTIQSIQLQSPQLINTTTVITTHQYNYSRHNSPIQLHSPQLTNTTALATTHQYNCTHHNSPIQLHSPQLTNTITVATTHLILIQISNIFVFSVFHQRHSTFYFIFQNYVISRFKTTFALYSTNWLVFITLMESVYSAVRTDCLYKADYA